MKFALFSLVINTRNPVTGELPAASEKFRRVIDQAALAEELGFDAYGVGERHGEPFLSSSPPVLLAAIAERTQRVRLPTTVTVLSILDPVRVAEDYATLDNLSGGRLELIIGKGNDPRHFPLFGLDQAELSAREVLELFVSEVAPVIRHELPSTVWDQPNQERSSR